MYDYSLLIGNGINNLSEGYSWDNVLKGLGDKYKVDINTNEKPFPLAYEEIYFKILKRKGNGNNENDIKNFIAEKIRKITANDIHQAIRELNCLNIMTTNYDLAFEDVLRKETKTTHLNNKGIIKEQRYNVFRHHELGEKRSGISMEISLFRIRLHLAMNTTAAICKACGIIQPQGVITRRVILTRVR